jgi:hypothetical protein
MALLCDPWATLYWIPPGSFSLSALNLGKDFRIGIPLFQIGDEEILNNPGRDRKASWA